MTRIVIEDTSGAEVEIRPTYANPADFVDGREDGCIVRLTFGGSVDVEMEFPDTQSARDWAELLWRERPAERIPY
jgi:hypothetical protein